MHDGYGNRCIGQATRPSGHAVQDRHQPVKESGHIPLEDSENPGEAGFTGSLVVAEFASLEAAQAWADADPYVAAGVYQQVSIKPFKKVLP